MKKFFLSTLLMAGLILLAAPAQAQFRGGPRVFRGGHAAYFAPRAFYGPRAYFGPRAYYGPRAYFGPVVPPVEVAPPVVTYAPIDPSLGVPPPYVYYDEVPYPVSWYRSYGCYGYWHGNSFYRWGGGARGFSRWNGGARVRFGRR